MTKNYNYSKIKAFNKTTVLVYDTNGNIVKKREYNYTLKEDLTELTYVEKLYTYDGDKLLSYNGEACVYDVMGRPTTYRNKSVAFTNGYMTSYDGITYEYDGFGRRVNINNLRTPLFDSDDNIVDDNKLTYIYDQTGVVGCYNGTTKYLYRKDTLGNIIAILDTNGLVVAKYVYDAWGNHKVFDASGVEIVDPNHVAIKNPFRYRSYYYDTETGLYYLKARYYDPETGRFISPDSIEYIDPETINGLNLYAYCGNNPVMAVDPNGNAWWNPFSWDWSKILTGVGLVATAVVAVTLAATTFGAGTPLAMGIVAGVTLTAGVLTGINGIATIGEGITGGYNFMRDGLFNSVLGLSDVAYNIYAGVVEGVAAIGSMVLGVYHTTGRFKATKYGQKYLGPGYKKAGYSNAGTPRYVSKDGLRQMRFDTSHMYKGKMIGKHMNLEFFKGTKPVPYQHVMYDLFKYWIL